jgi:hypothetical protein
MCGAHNRHCFILMDEVEERRIDCPERGSGVVEAAAHAGPSLLLLSLSVALLSLAAVRVRGSLVPAALYPVISLSMTQ